MAVRTKRIARRRRRIRGVHRPHRGMALVEALLGGMLLAAGMGVVMSLSTRALRAQVQGEKKMTAAWLADDVLNMVLAEGPDDFERAMERRGSFDVPFEEFTYEILTENLGVGVPWRVTAIIQWGDRPNESVTVETLIAERLGEDEEEPPREPYEEVDRDARWFDDEEGA